MNTALLCPHPNTLRQFAAGRLPYPDSEPIAHHLSACPACASLCDAEFAGVIELLKGADPTDNSLPAELPDLLARIRTDVTMRTPGPVPGRFGLAPPTDDDIVRQILDRVAPPSEAGDMGRLGKFRLLRVLGQGGMGVVFEAADDDLRRAVAVKVIRGPAGESATERERFLREARAAAALDHENILPVYQIDTHNPGEMTYLVTPLLKGESLSDRIRRGGLPLADALLIAKQTADGLAAAHAAGLVHRDIKPSNLWLEERPEGFRVRILDFGLAKPVDGSAEISQAGTPAGTPAYMAPEQWDGEAVDHRADLWALGAVLYEMVTGSRPFRGDSIGAIRRAALGAEPESPGSLVPDLSPAVADLIVGLLRKVPTERMPRTAREVSAALGGATAVAPVEPITAPAPVPVPLPRKKPTRRTKFGRAVAVAGVLAVSLLVAQVIVRVKRKEGEPPVEMYLAPGTKVKVDEKGVIEITPPGQPPGEPVPPIPKADGRTLDHFRRAAIKPEVLAAIGGGNAAGAAPELVAVVGELGPNKPAVGAGHTGPIISLHVVPDGKTLVTTGQDGTVRLWKLDAPTPVEFAVLQHHKKPIVASALSADGTLLATTDSAVLAVWDLARRKMSVSTDANAILTTLAFSPDNTLLAAGTGTDVTLVYNAKTLAKVKEATTIRKNIYSVRFAEDGNTLIIGGRGEIKAVDLRTDTVKMHQVENRAWFKTFALSQDGRWLGTNGGLAPMKPGSLVGVIDLPNEGPRTEGTMFSVRDVKNAFATKQLLNHPGRVFWSSFSPNGELLATLTQTHRLTVWRWAAEKQVFEFTPPEQLADCGPTDVQFHPDGRHVLLSLNAGIVLVFRLPQQP